MPGPAAATNRSHCAIFRSDPTHRQPWLARLALALATLACTSWAGADTCRVTESGTDLGDGSDWNAQALALQAALAMPACTEIWVEAGVYKPTTGTDETTSFNIRPGAAVYGGFDGTEDTREERNPVVNTTILSGDIDDDDIDDNGNHIADDYNDLRGANTNRLILMDGTTAAGPITAGTVLDGFVVTAAECREPECIGAGMYCNGLGSGHECSPTLGQLRFIGNRGFSGGAIYNHGSSGGISSPALDGVEFVSNYAEIGGGAMVNASSDGGISSPMLTNVVFSDNVAGQSGGAMYGITASGTISPVLVNVTFSGNHAYSNGGAMGNLSSGDSGSNTPSLTNVTFHENTAGKGGAIHSSGGSSGETSPALINVTFSANHAASGGAIYTDPG